MKRFALLILFLPALVASSCGGGEESVGTVEAQPTSTTATVATIATSTTTAPIAPVGTDPATTTTLLRMITDDEPLTMWIIGDSFLELFGPALLNRGADTGVVDAEVDFRYVSGLSRPDYFDWPAYIAEQLPAVDPDAVVVMFGGNDAQDVEYGGERFDVGTQAWVDLYAMRVAEAMDVLLTGTDRVYWIGLPIMKSDRFTTNARTMNSVYESEAAVRSRVTYIPCFDLFTDEDGEYSAYLDGKLVRFTDGAHFVWNGAYRLADAVLPVIAADWDIPVDR